LGDDCTYIEADKWHPKDKEQKIAPVNARVQDLSSFYLANDLTYSTYTTSPKNSVIEFRVTSGKTAFGRIARIFKHRRVTHDEKACFDTWFVIDRFPELQPNFLNPFAKLSKYHLKTALRYFTSKNSQLIHASEIVCHCAWIHYKADEISPALPQDTIALISLSR
jgi:hypothetical protein